MKISLKPQHLKRYKDFALLFLKYGNSDLVNQLGMEEVLDEKEALSAGSEYRTEQLTDELGVRISKGFSYFSAAGGGFWLVISIFMQDRHGKKKNP